ncbi:MAG: thiamine ABC transporter substrate-binding protein [Hydrogenophaga sp.]|uniref:thiamine ABC transporter substrate-binding protein n=1 Tax=Hydrogenophaga sp. TaxID=1904254 RepID=UPI0016AFBEDD|nr:thiamine ABC transporter substrate-binding protein [Hydrogenophaga sp.]NIM42131.1 thiamine ABC transporter substrate-binding protein [Hydrogenophaga sp.]NIN27426.1 thiamine ABC transporter substrate-binding protein [Hydrogenophaga sp.]NIN32127.1 thiamine ABC transporter substrate-binding protein [Hydrogenophaga sp.]NIN56285.1 thiamine ABC transporter substrate-binding protein [Hydrogenophaga sp.]NIO52508.1 thiamine ABC transporter substrate-binding protein [Hydrogenophaga sp.]
MQRRSILLLPALAWAPGLAVAQTPLRVLTHDSFDLPAPLLARFEREAGAKLQVIKGGDAGEMLNRLILTRARPIADVVFGIDNALLPRARQAGMIDPYNGPAAQRPSAASLGDGVVPVDHSYVALNIDKAWFAQKGLALPRSLDDLAQAAYKDLLVVPHPATSSPGQAFLQATIAGLGEEGAFDWWARMRRNGLKVVKGWSEAYYTEFSRNGGARPIVVSYATSPAAEVFFSKTPLAESPTASLFLPGGVFRQVEGVALVKGSHPAAREAAGRFIEFLRSPPVQQALQTSMWMYPAEPGAARAEVLKKHAPEPTRFDNPPAERASEQLRAWQDRWVKTVLR